MSYTRKQRPAPNRPPFGFPGFPGFPGPQRPQGPQGPQGPPSQGQGQGAPTGPPPNIVPSEAKATQLNANVQGPGQVTTFVDPGAIFPCRNRFSYIWLRGGRSFWAYITFVGRTSLSGFRWNGRRWIYFGVELRRIRSFICY